MALKVLTLGLAMASLSLFSCESSLKVKTGGEGPPTQGQVAPVDVDPSQGREEEPGLLPATKFELANAAKDGFINLSEAADSDAVASLDPSPSGDVAFALIAGDLVCGEGRAYDLKAVPSIREIATDGRFRLCLRIGSSDRADYLGTDEFSRDTVAPGVTVAPFGSSHVNASNHSSYIHAAGTCQLAGGNVTVTFSQAGRPAVAKVVGCPDGSWRGQEVDLSQLSDGVISVTARQSDEAGNVGAAAADVIKDTVAPVVNAGADLSAAVPTVLGANVSDSGGTGIATVEWTKISGPGSVTFSPSAKALNPSVANDSIGSVTLRLTAVDVAGNAAQDDVVFTSNSLLPFSSVLSQVATTISYESRRSSQRHTFFDSVTQKHWVIFKDGPMVRTAYSVDSETWTLASSVAVDTPDMSITYKDMAGTGCVFMVAEENAGDVTLRRGFVGATGIAFGPAVTVFDGTGLSNAYSLPSVALDDANVWVAANHFSGALYSVKVRESLGVASGDLTNWSAPVRVGLASSLRKDAVLVPKSGGQMYLLSQQDKNLSGFTFDGSTWSEALSGGDLGWFVIAGSTAPNSLVNAVALLGTTVYVGGSFVDLGGNVRSDRLAAWDGFAWTNVGEGLNGAVTSLLVTGGRLYVGGAFTDAGGIPEADYIAAWDGSRWLPLGPGLDSAVLAMAAAGSNLYVGGYFSAAGGDPNARKVARWDGNSWSALGAGLSSAVAALGIVGTDVYAGGYFVDAGGDPSGDYFARWDGNAWTSVGGGLNAFVFAITTTLNGDVYAGGLFFDAGGIPEADHVARWNGTSWSALGPGIDSSVMALAASGSDVYAAGSFSQVGGNSSAANIARWDGTSWHTLGSGVTSFVRALTVSGSSVYIGGDFYDAGGDPGADRVALWNGSSFQSLPSPGIVGQVFAIVASGSDFYVGGSFKNVGGIAEADGIVRWNGSTWSAVGNGLNGDVYALAVSGGDIYAGGSFHDAGGNTSADGVARWDGTTWQALGPGVAGSVNALAVQDGELYVGGNFIDAGGNSDADRIARWDGSTWNAMETGLNAPVFAIQGSSAGVYVGGDFTNAGGIAAADRIALWNGSNWAALGSGLNLTVTSISVSGGDIYAGGSFLDAGGNPDADRLARWDGSAWHSIGLAPNGYVQGLAISGGRLYAAGNFTSIGGSSAISHIASWDGSIWRGVVDPSGGAGVAYCAYADGGSIYFGYDSGFAVLKASGASDAVGFSGVSDAAGDLRVAYNTSLGDIESRTLNAGGWQTTSSLLTSDASSVVLASDLERGDTYAFWTANDQLNFKVHDGSTWDSGVATLAASGVHRLSCDPRAGGGKIKCLWTSGAASPYAVSATFIVPSN